MRYWDGNAWTAHTAPSPAAQPQAQQVQPHTQQVQPHHVPQEPQPTQPQTQPPAAAPQGTRVWTPSTIVTLLVCLVLVIGVSITAGMVRSEAATGHERQAEETLEEFLRSSTTGDTAWRDHANHKLLDEVTVGAPLLGEQSTAEALNLSVSYEVGPLTFHSDLPGYPADLASAQVQLTYNFTLRDDAVESTAVQDVWLSRPFYYGDDVPARATEEEPTAVGPWRVTSLTMPRSDSDGSDGRYFTTDFEVPGLEDADGNICFDAARVLEDVSTAARVDEELLSHCFVFDGSIALDEEVDVNDLVTNFPVINSMQGGYLPTELVRLDPGHTNNSALPLTEYLIQGEKGKYVLTLAMVGVSGIEDMTVSNRIVSIQLAEEGQS